MSVTPSPSLPGNQAATILLGFRFVLKLLGANPLAGFTNFIYTLSSPFASPFLNVFKASRVEGSVFEWTTILAILVYSLVAWGIVKIFFMSKTISTPEAATKLNEEE